MLRCSPASTPLVRILAPEVLVSVVEFLPVNDVLVTALVSRCFHGASRSEYVWESHTRRRINHLIGHLQDPVVEDVEAQRCRSSRGSWWRAYESLRYQVLTCGRNEEVVDWGIEAGHMEPEVGMLGRPVSGGESNGYEVVPALIGVMPSKVVSSGYHSIVLTRDGDVYTWGSNAFGQLGVGTRIPGRVPTKLTFPPGVRIAQVSAGFALSAAIDTNGVLYTWGFNKNGRLAHPDEHPGVCTPYGPKYPMVLEPHPVEALKGQKVVSIACGSGHMVCIVEPGEVYAWGRNDCGQLGRVCPDADEIPDSFVRDLPHTSRTFQPRKVPLPSPVSIVCAFAYSSFASDVDGTVWLWGALTSGGAFTAPKMTVWDPANPEGDVTMLMMSYLMRVAVRGGCLYRLIHGVFHPMPMHMGPGEDSDVVHISGDHGHAIVVFRGGAYKTLAEKRFVRATEMCKLGDGTKMPAGLQAVMSACGSNHSVLLCRFGSPPTHVERG